MFISSEVPKVVPIVHFQSQGVTNTWDATCKCIAWRHAW